MHAAFGEPGIGVQFLGVHAETGDTPQRHLRRIVRNPGRHQVEDIGALEEEFPVPAGKRLDGGLVDVLHEPRFPVKLVVGRRVDALEEVFRQFPLADVFHRSVRAASEPARATGRAAIPETCYRECRFSGTHRRGMHGCRGVLANFVNVITFSEAVRLWGIGHGGARWHTNW